MKLKLFTKVCKSANKAKMVISKNAPKICLVLGVAGFGGSVGYAVYATTKAKPIIEEAKEMAIEIHNANIETYTDELKKVDMKRLVLHTSWEMFKLYWPSLLMFAGGTTGVVASYKFSSRQIKGLSASLATELAAGNELRKRIIEKYGEEEYDKLKYGIKEETVEITDPETGKKKKVKRNTIDSASTISDYTYVLDKHSRVYVKDEAYMRMFISSQQRYCNECLNAIERVFLFDALRALDIPEDKKSHIVGWLKNDDTSDGHIDFRMKVVYPKDDPEYPIYVFDFNVDGDILNNSKSF